MRTAANLAALGANVHTSAPQRPLVRPQPTLVSACQRLRIPEFKGPLTMSLHSKFNMSGNNAGQVTFRERLPVKNARTNKREVRCGPFCISWRSAFTPSKIM
jgi:hypothetical protein